LHFRSQNNYAVYELST